MRFSSASRLNHLGIYWSKLYRSWMAFMHYILVTTLIHRRNLRHSLHSSSVITIVHMHSRTFIIADRFNSLPSNVSCTPRTTMCIINLHFFPLFFPYFSVSVVFFLLLDITAEYRRVQRLFPGWFGQSWLGVDGWIEENVPDSLNHLIYRKTVCIGKVRAWEQRACEQLRYRHA